MIVPPGLPSLHPPPQTFTIPSCRAHPPDSLPSGRLSTRPPTRPGCCGSWDTHTSAAPHPRSTASTLHGTGPAGVLTPAAWEGRLKCAACSPPLMSENLRRAACAAKGQPPTPPSPRLPLPGLPASKVCQQGPGEHPLPYPPRPNPASLACVWSLRPAQRWARPAAAPAA